MMRLCIALRSVLGKGKVCWATGRGTMAKAMAMAWERSGDKDGEKVVVVAAVIGHEGWACCVVSFRHR